MYVVSVTEFLLVHNFFSFNGDLFLQICSCPMGACFSPSFANLYMSWLEEDHLYATNNPYRASIAWYGRYIDDLLLIWQGMNRL